MLSEEIGVLIINDDEQVLKWAKDDLIQDKNRRWKCVCVETQEDLDAVWSHLDRFSVAIIDARLPTFDYKNGFTLAEILIKHGLKVSIASVAIEQYHKQWGSRMGIPTFDTLNMQVNESEGNNVFQIIARKTLEFQPTVQREQET